MLDNLLLEAVVDDLKVLFLDLNHLLLVVEVVEAVDEVEAIVAELALIYCGGTPSSDLQILRSMDGLSNCSIVLETNTKRGLMLFHSPAKPVARAKVAQVLKKDMLMGVEDGAQLIQMKD